MWSDVCLRLKCPNQTPVKILKMYDLNDKRSDKVLEELRSVDRLVVIMPDRQNNIVWQTIWFCTLRRYFYHPHTQLLGVSGWSHWALLLDWSVDIKVDDTITPGREYSAAELDGKIRRTQSSRRRYRKRQFESDPGYVPPQK